MEASQVSALAATGIALAALGISVYEARAQRQHNRLSVRPVLQIRTIWRDGQTAGIHVKNVGIGPAEILETVVQLDGKDIGPFNKGVADTIREPLAPRPHAVTLGGRPILEAHYEQFLLSVEAFDKSRHADFVSLVEQRLQISILYQSLYGSDRRIARLHS